MADQELDVLIKFLIDQSAKGDTAAAIDYLTHQMQEFNESIEEAKKRARELKSLARDLGQISREAFLLGATITGGIFAAANKYVKDAKEATAVTIAWKQAQESLGKSGARFGAVLAQEALPLLQKAATLADRASRFVEKHPEIVQAALNTGLVLAGLGAVGTAVSKGIRLYADIAYLAAVAQKNIGDRVFADAVNKFLIGTSQFAGAKGGGAAAAAGGGLGGVAKTIGSVTLVASAVIIGSEIGAALGNFIARTLDPKAENWSLGKTILQGGIRPFEQLGRSITLQLHEWGIASKDTTNGILEQIKTQDDWFSNILGVTKETEKASEEVDKFAGALAGIDPKTLEKAAQDLANFQAESLAAEQKYNDDRLKIITDANRAAEDVSRQSGARLAQIAEQARNQIEQARIQAAQADAQATADYLNQREEIIKSGNEDIARIEADAQEQLAKQAEEHNQRVQDLTAARDALGLAKENRDFAKQQAETRKDAEKEAVQRRHEIQQRLADLQAGYEQERAQRAADLEARIEEIRTQAEAERKENIATAAAEIERIQQERNTKLRELDTTYNAEREHRYQAFVGQLRELDAHLLGEYQLQQQRHAEMLTDLDVFLAKYKAGLGSLATAVPAKAAGGYSAGLVSTGEEGYEYILSHSTTRAAENIIGGRLTQDALLAALMNSGGRTSVTWNDQRRFDGAYTNEIRRANRKDTMEILEGIFS